MLLIATVSLFEAKLFFGIVYSDSKLYIATTRSFLDIAPSVHIAGITVGPPVPFLAATLSSFL